MKTIIFIGTQKSGSSREAIIAAKQLGYFTVLLTNKRKQITQRDEYKDVNEIILCNLNNYEELKKIIYNLQEKALQIESIISFIEPYVYMACKLAEEFEVNRFTTDAIVKMHNKIFSRNTLKHTPYAPRFMMYKKMERFNRDQIEEMLPFIVKSPNSTGSRDVYLIHNYEEFIHYLARNDDYELLIEEYLKGPQYLVETIVINKEVHFIAIIEQEIEYLNKHFIVTGYNLIIRPDNLEIEEFKKAVKEIINYHGLENGPCHLEMRYVKGEWKLIEINPRMSGGSMNEFIELGLGINLAKEIIKLSLGEDVELKPKFKRYLFTQHILATEEGTLKKVNGKTKARNGRGVKSVYVRPRKGARISLPISMGYRYAFVIATGHNEKDAKINAKNAAKEIKFHLVE